MYPRRRIMPKQEVMRALLRAGYPSEMTDEIETLLPDPVDIDRDAHLPDRFGVRRTASSIVSAAARSGPGGRGQGWPKPALVTFGERTQDERFEHLACALGSAATPQGDTLAGAAVYRW